MPHVIKSSFTAAAEGSALRDEPMVYMGLLSKDRPLDAADMRVMIGMENAESDNPMLFNTITTRAYSYTAENGDKGTLHFCCLLVPGTAIEEIGKVQFPEGVFLNGFRKCDTYYSDFARPDFMPHGFSQSRPTGWEKFRAKLGF